MHLGLLADVESADTLGDRKHTHLWVIVLIDQGCSWQVAQRVINGQVVWQRSSNAEATLGCWQALTRVVCECGAAQSVAIYIAIYRTPLCPWFVWPLIPVPHTNICTSHVSRTNTCGSDIGHHISGIWLLPPGTSAYLADPSAFNTASTPPHAPGQNWILDTVKLLSEASVPYRMVPNASAREKTREAQLRV